MRKVLSLTLIVVVACTALAEHPGIADGVVPEYEHAAAANHEDHDEHEVKPDLSMTEELLSHEEHEQTLVEHRSRVTPSVLIAADAISAELTSIKQSAKSDPVVAQIESTVLSMTNAMAPSCLAKDSSDKEVCKAKTTKNSCEGLLDAGSNKRCTFADTDGGTQDMDDRLNSAMNSINTAADTMLSGTKTDYDEAKADLKALDDSIDISKKTISTTDLESIRTAATTWCAKKRALETATTDKQTAAATLNNKLNAPLGLTDLKLSEVGPIGAGDCSQDNGDDEALTSCPAYICSDDNLAQRIKEKIATGRAAYLTASWDKYNNNLAFGNATNENTAKKSVFQDKVTTTASTYHSMCHSDSSVHATAVTSFNANNANRASRYLSLGIIKCHINHMKSDQEYVFSPADLLKSASSNSATSSTDCIANLQTAANIKIALFPDASPNEASSKVCPTLSAYETDIRNYGSLDFDKDVWTPSEANCNSVASHSPVVTCGITGSQYGIENPAYAQCSASSVYDRDAMGYNHGQGRLDSVQFAWTSGGGVGSWWQMDLGSVKQIAGVVTQGRPGGYHTQYVSKIKVSVSTDGITWADVDGGHVFTANTATPVNLKVENKFASVVESRYVRIVVQAYHWYPSMRSAVLVCNGP